MTIAETVGAVTAHPTLKGTPGDREVRDLATKNATWRMWDTTMGGYLEWLGIYKDGAVEPEQTPISGYQRNKIPIAKNPVKKRMLRDLLRGGTLPTIVTIAQRGRAPEIADGLQRTDVITEALRILLATERGDSIERYLEMQLQELRDQGQAPLSVPGFLNQPLTLQVWNDLENDEKLRLFMVLNVGQQKVSPRHLLEIARPNLRSTFADWGIKLLSEREEKALPKRVRKDTPPSVIPAITHYRYELLIDSLQAYVSNDPHTKTRSILEGEGLNDTLSARITEVGSEACRDDFQWVCLSLNSAIRSRYAGRPKWEMAVQNNDNYVIPLFAALGDVRERDEDGMATELAARKNAIVELLDRDEDPDPLHLFDGVGNLEAVQAQIKSNIGRRHRAIVFFAWRTYFLRGADSAGFPVNWNDAAIAS